VCVSWGRNVCASERISGTATCSTRDDCLQFMSIGDGGAVTSPGLPLLELLRGKWRDLDLVHVDVGCLFIADKVDVAQSHWGVAEVADDTIDPDQLCETEKTFTSPTDKGRPRPPLQTRKVQCGEDKNEGDEEDVSGVEELEVPGTDWLEGQKDQDGEEDERDPCMNERHVKEDHGPHFFPVGRADFVFGELDTPEYDMD